MLENDGSTPNISGPSPLTQRSIEKTEIPPTVNGENDVKGDEKAVVYESDKHLTNLKTFAQSMSAATERCLKARKTFEKVAGVITYWEDPKDLPHLKANAQLLHDLLNDEYKFDVKDYPIPRNVTDVKFVVKIDPYLDQVREDPNSLFIFYYAGHATAPGPNGTLDEKRLWMPENRIGKDDSKIEWSSVSRTLFNGVKCQVLFLLDCCQAGSMINETMEWAACEMLAACPPEHKAFASEISSFTKALYTELKEGLHDVVDLHSELCSREKRLEYSLKSDAWYRHFTSKPRYMPSALIRKVDAPSTQDSEEVLRTLNGEDRLLARLKRTSNAKVLIAVTFKGSADAIIKMLSGDEIRKEFENWFRHAPIHVLDLVFTAVKQVVLESLFESNSCVATWSIPLWLWDCLPYDPRYKYLGVIRSSNYATSNMPRLQLQGFDRLAQPIDSTMISDGGWSLVRGSTEKKPVQIQPDDSSSVSSITSTSQPIVYIDTPPPSPPLDPQPVKWKSSGGLFSGLSRRIHNFPVEPSPQKPQNQAIGLKTPPLSPLASPLLIPQSFQFSGKGGRPALKMEDVVRSPSDKKVARRIDKSRLSRRWENAPVPISNI